MFAGAARAGMQSGTIMCIADVVTQVAIEGRRIGAETGGPEADCSGHDANAAASTPPSHEPYDPRRTLRWATAGLFLHGPYFYVGFSRLDGYFGATTHLSTVLKKTAVAQFVLFPPYLVALFAYMGVTEGCDDVPRKVRRRVPEAFVGGCVFWPVANGINFAVVPSTLRVPYLAASSGVWNCYLSWANARGNETDASTTTEAKPST